MKANKNDLHESGRVLTQEEFINKIKTNDEFAKKWGDLGKIYGFQWRNWGSEEILVEKSFVDDEGFGYKIKVKEQTKGIDQISELIKQLKDNPDSRRMVVNAWAVHDLPNMTLPPCHYGFQVYTRELNGDERWDLLKKNVGKELFDSWVSEIVPFGGGLSEYLQLYNIPTRAISLMWNQRSVDTFLGLPFNIASYGLLLEIIAKAVNMVPDELIGNLGDVHLYSNHVDQALEQIGRYLEVDERVCMCYENPSLDLTRIQEGMSDSEFTKVCDEFGIPTRTREPFELPTLNINTEFWPYEGGECGVGPIDAMSVIKSFSDDNFCRCLLEEDIQLGNYQSHGTIKAPLSN
jgi:thymidylate synthase